MTDREVVPSIESKTNEIPIKNPGVKILKIIKKSFFWFFNAVCITFIIYQLCLYFQDKKAVNNFVKYLRNNELIGRNNSPYKKALIIRDHLLDDINPNTKTCKYFNHSTRPLWGYRTSTILKYKEGQCGELSRLLLNVFSVLNIPSRKVYLYSFGNIHAALEIYSGEKWILLDSIQAPPNFREYTIKEEKGIIDYFDTDIRGLVSPSEELSSFGFINYSYFNWNKLLNYWVFGDLGTSIYTHQPVFDKYQIILENPSLFFVLLILFLQIFINLIFLLCKLLHAYCRKH